MKTAICLSALVLTACSSAPPLFTSDNRPTDLIACPGSSWDLCHSRAAKQCGAAGFDVIQRNDDDDATRSMLIACKAAPN
ncbi:MAG: hypothetical protein KGK15_03770 [Burkholderiales bacterium]|nr:hypothetical protein [Burkholderiales bacterium]MDE2287357.1 hypothetical protein [Burkholderiales bacterium]MDE2610609.1 hypothetical protein [Burkholderiales bacterium]